MYVITLCHITYYNIGLGHTHTKLKNSLIGKDHILVNIGGNRLVSKTVRIIIIQPVRVIIITYQYGNMTYYHVYYYSLLIGRVKLKIIS